MTDGSRLIGLLTRELITETLHKRGPSVPVREVMVTDFPTVSEQAPLTDVFQKIQTTGFKAVPIVSGSELRGLITLEQIARYNMLCSGYSCDSPATSEIGCRCVIPMRLQATNITFLSGQSADGGIARLH